MLEDNQVLIQGMMANRYMDTFRDPILGWNKKLMAVADVVAVVSEVQVSIQQGLVSRLATYLRCQGLTTCVGAAVQKTVWVGLSHVRC
jgi:hypothetical protein